MSLEIKDLGLARIRKQLEELQRSQFTIGWQGASGDAQHPGSKAASNATVASYVEVERPVVQTAYELHGEEIEDEIRRGLADLVDGRAELEEVEDRIGEVMVGKLRETMTSARDWAKPLEDSTARRKGHDQPLVDTWTLYHAASYAVRRDGVIVRQGGELDNG